MNLFVIISFALLGILAFVIQKKRRFEQVDILHLLLFSALAILLKSDFEDEKLAGMWTYSMIALLGINFLLSRWSKLRKPALRLVPPIVTVAILLGIFWNDSFIYLGENFNISDKATWVLPLLGIVMYELAFTKLRVLRSFFGMNQSILNIVMIFLIGVSVLIGAFNAQGYGVFLVASGFLASSFYNPTGSKHMIHSILAVSLVWMFADQNAIELIDVRFPKVIGGLFVGAFVGAFLPVVWVSQKRLNLALIMGYFLSALFMIGLLVLGTKINPAFGGVEAFLAGLIGFALANAVLSSVKDSDENGQAPIAMSGLVLIVLIGMIVPPMLVNEEELAVQDTLDSIVPKNEEGEEIVVPFISFEGLTGKYEVIQETSLISFKLGPDGSVTKGAIKEFTGTFNFDEELANSTFDIKLPVLNLTTFVPMRNKSLMGEEYFNQEKFPSMRFKGSKMTPTEKENEFEMLGSFEMIGYNKEEKVLVHRIEEEGKTVLVGSGEIDRREYGMSDDPREGNVVSFEFKVELK